MFWREILILKNISPLTLTLPPHRGRGEFA